ncbi:hypothetical protein Q5P01_000724 [Channa striata]|uniref:Uncharacterized protein n=1 Tax=Channa striata TaxID=64152 RepID=A0AA88IRK1_CHASR|nr:hypothetical protein Q5P01_000724 [Channa striata]
MGLKHRAIHAMLANPDLAPFEVLDEPLERQDWILIDHLMVIHKVKESDYVESEPATSVLNMARTLARNYMPEGPRARSVVLVKDGPGAQKPSVRGIRSARATAPHVEFCKRHLGEIEYAAMKLLADVGMKEKLFLVTGAEWGHGESSPGSSAGLDGDLVSFHFRYLDCRELEEDRRYSPSRGPSRQSRGQRSSRTWTRATATREGRSDSETGQQELSRGSSDARLALWGAALGAEPRESARLGSSARRRELSRRSLPSPVRRDFERILEDHRGASFRSEAVDYLYRGGVRGSVYVAFLGRFFESDARNDLNSFALELQKPRERSSANAVRYVFETLCDTGEKRREETPTRAASSQKKEKKRKRRRDPGSGADGAEEMLGEPRKMVTVGMARMAKAYVNGAVPRASHARFLRLSRVGRHMFLRVKTAVVRDERVRAERVLFMALCGTDYRSRARCGAADGTREEARAARLSLHGVAPPASRDTAKIRDKHWTGAKCELMFRTLKYVCDLWALKKPQIGPEYGFSVHDDGVARFLGESREALPSPPSP